VHHYAVYKEKRLRELKDSEGRGAVQQLLPFFSAAFPTNKQKENASSRNPERTRVVLYALDEKKVA
jgi:hypothetical protein